MNDSLILSVLLPIKNDPPFLINTCIQSLKSQTFSNFELIIIDDSDQFETINAIDSIKDLNLRIIRDKRSKMGLASALNVGIKLAKGKYFARVDVDDIQDPKRFEKQLNFLYNNPNVDVVGCNTYIIDIVNQIIGKKIFPETDDEIKKQMCIRNPLSHPTLMFRKSFFDILIGYNENSKRAEDYELWFNARKKKQFKFYNLQDKLVLYRISNIKKRDFLNWAINLKLKFKFFELKYFFYSCLGIILTLVFLILPNFIKSSIYKKYSTW